LQEKTLICPYKVERLILQKTNSDRSLTMDLWETYADCCETILRDCLQSGESQADALSALGHWGFDPDRLDEVPVGLFSDRPTVQQGLIAAGFSAEAIHAAKVLADARLPGRLIGPIRDPDKRIVSFWARDPRNIRSKDLYLHANWKQRVPLFGLDVALPATAEHHGLLIIVEDLLDALLFHEQGIGNTAAIAGPLHEMTAARWNSLGSLGLRAVILAPDNGDSVERHREILETLRLAFRTAVPQIFVLDPDDLQGMPRPAEFLRHRGRSQFLALLETLCISPGQYKAQAIRLPVVETPSQPAPPPRPKPKPAVKRVSRGGYCTLHRCGETDCFCFD